VLACKRSEEIRRCEELEDKEGEASSGSESCLEDRANDEALGESRVGEGGMTVAIAGMNCGEEVIAKILN